VEREAHGTSGTPGNREANRRAIAGTAEMTLEIIPREPTDL